MTSWSIVTASARHTRALGGKVAKNLEGGEIIGLSGELGSGKTCFVRGLAEGLEVGRGTWVRSPTFTLINEYNGRLPIYHIDLYRIGSRDELAALHLREYLYSDAVSLIEWFDRFPFGEVDEFLELKFVHAGGNRRELTFTAHGERYERIVESLKAGAEARRSRSRKSEYLPQRRKGR